MEFLNFILFIFLYGRFLLVIHFIHISVYMSTPISQFITPPPPPCHSPPLVPILSDTPVLKCHFGSAPKCYLVQTLSIWGNSFPFRNPVQSNKNWISPILFWKHIISLLPFPECLEALGKLQCVMNLGSYTVSFPYWALQWKGTVDACYFTFGKKS